MSPDAATLDPIRSGHLPGRRLHAFLCAITPRSCRAHATLVLLQVGVVNTRHPAPFWNPTGPPYCTWPAESCANLPQAPAPEMDDTIVPGPRPRVLFSSRTRLLSGDISCARVHELIIASKLHPRCVGLGVSQLTQLTSGPD